MTLGTCHRTGFVAGSLLGLVAFDTKLVHNLFGDQFLLFLEPRNYARLLGKKRMTDVAVTQFVLMPVMGEMHHAAFAAIQRDLLGAFVFHNRGTQRTGQYQEEDNCCSDFHQKLLPSCFGQNIAIMYFFRAENVKWRIRA